MENKINQADKINKFELKRKLLHLTAGIISLLFLIYKLITPFQIFLILMSGTLLSLIHKKIQIPIVSYFLNNFERKEEREHLPGRALIFAVAGALLALQLFPRNIALASISILIFADPISSLIGINFGKTKSFINEKKNIEGHIAAALISSMIAWFFVPFYLAIIGAITAMLFESLIIQVQKIKLDDNLIIPIAAGTAMLIVIKFLI